MRNLRRSRRSVVVIMSVPPLWPGKVSSARNPASDDRETPGRLHSGFACRTCRWQYSEDSSRLANRPMSTGPAHPKPGPLNEGHPHQTLPHHGGSWGGLYFPCGCEFHCEFPTIARRCRRRGNLVVAESPASRLLRFARNEPQEKTRAVPWPRLSLNIRYCGPPRIDAGCPGSLKRGPASASRFPSHRNIDRSPSMKLPT